MIDFERVLGRVRPATVWRVVAMLMLLLRGVRTAVRFFGLDPRLAPQAAEQAASLPFFMLFSGLTVIAFAVLVAFPLRFYLYAAICVFWGLFYAIDDGGAVGCVIYGIGVYFARAQGFYRTRGGAKAAGTVLLLLAAVGSQYRYGLTILLDTLLDSLVVLFLYMACRFAIPLVFCVRSPDAMPEIPVQEARGSPALDLPEGDKVILERIQAGDKYDAIAKDFGVSPRTMDRRIKELYAALGAANRADFLRRYGRRSASMRLDQKPVRLIAGPADFGDRNSE